MRVEDTDINNFVVTDWVTYGDSFDYRYDTDDHNVVRRLSDGEVVGYRHFGNRFIHKDVIKRKPHSGYKLAGEL